MMFDSVKKYFSSGSERSIIVKKNIAHSFVFKAISIVLSLQIVPLTINYVSAEQYGIWLTISSIVAWISYFDLGLGHGLRNKFAEAKAKGNYELASRYISTAYAVFALIFLCLFLVFAFINFNINWSNFLNVSQVSNEMLQRLLFILVSFFCLNMFFKVINSLLLGDQKTAFASGVSVSEQLFSLVVIYILSKTTQSNLVYLAFSSSCVPFIVLLFVTLFLFSKKGFFHLYSPSFNKIDFSLTKALLGLGVKFFIVQVSLLVIFQFVNIILSRNCGQIAVVQYNLSYKYFNMLYMVAIIILAPYWSAFTDAYTRQDYAWMKSAFTKLNKFALAAIPVVILMCIVAPVFFRVWIGKSVEVPFTLHLCMALYIYAMTFAGLHMYLLNGMGKVTIQLIVYVFFAIITIPLMDFLSQTIGIYGVLLLLTIIYLAQAIIGRIQIIKIISRKEDGIWGR